jgi:hypothetical protein
VKRRSFLKLLGLAGGAVALGISVLPEWAKAEYESSIVWRPDGFSPWDIEAFTRMLQDNTRDIWMQRYRAEYQRLCS